MIGLPFLFFFIWTIISFRKHGISIGTYVLSIYTLSSLCSILIDSMNLYEKNSVPDLEVGFFAPLLYIFLLFFCLKPIYSIGKISILPPTIRAERLLKFISVCYLFMFIIVLSVSYERIIFVIASESLANIRNEQYTGDAVSFYDYLTGFKRYVCAIFSVISQSSYIMLLVFFYLMAYSKCSFLYKISAFVGSMTPLLISINIADRSTYFYWMIMLGFSLVLFYKSLPANSKRVIFILIILALSVILFYFISVTNSRFGERDNGSIGGLILYAGQSFHNFCKFVNYLDPPNTLNIIFPNITTYIFNGDNYFSLAHKIEAQQHIALCVFPTFLGIIYSVSGFFVTFAFIAIFIIIGKRFEVVLKNNVVKIGNVIEFWCWAIIPSIGIITYFYLNSGGTTALIIWLILSRLIKK